MRKSLLAAAILFLGGGVGSAQDKPLVRVLIVGAPEQVEKAAVDLLARDGFSLESKTASQLRISKPFSPGEMAAYNTAHWTNEPMGNCRHVQIFSLSPTDGVVMVGAVSEVACNPAAGKWMYLRTSDEKESASMQSTLDSLKARVEETNRRR